MRKLVVLCALTSISMVLGLPAGIAITNGQSDGTRHPEVGALVGYFAPAGKAIAYCSGTLISPTVFLTAAHCGFLGTPTVGVTFDETYTQTSTVYTGRSTPTPTSSRAPTAKATTTPTSL